MFNTKVSLIHVQYVAVLFVHFIIFLYSYFFLE